MGPSRKGIGTFFSQSNKSNHHHPVCPHGPVQGRACSAYIDLASGCASFLSRLCVHTVASGKQRMVHALCCLNEVTTKRPCKYELVQTSPSVLRPNDWMLSVDAEAAFWSVLIHPKSRKFMSSHYAFPAFYHVNGKSTFVLLQPGGRVVRVP